MKNWRKMILVWIFYAHTILASSLQDIDKVAAIINNGIILESDINQLMQSIKLNAEQDNILLHDDKSLHHQVLEHLIMDNIQLQMAQNMSIIISDADLDRAITNIAMQNKITLHQLRTRLFDNKLDYNHYRSQIRKEMLITEVRNQEVRRRITILPQEVDQLAKQIAFQNNSNAVINLSHILLHLPENPSYQQLSTTEALAKKIIEKLNSGIDFGKIAMAYSSEPQARNNGEIGWKKLQELPTLFAQNLINAKKGLIVGPLHSGIGLHILKVNDIYGGIESRFENELHIRHILLKPSVDITDHQIHIKLESLAKYLKYHPDKFADEAKSISQDLSSALQGGDLGWISLDIYDSSFRNALIKLNKGEISAPVHSLFGWHLIQVLDIRKVDKTEDSQKNIAYQILFNRKFVEATQSWMQEIRAKAYVNILNNDDL